LTRISGNSAIGAQRQAAHAATVTDLIEPLGFIGFSEEIVRGTIRGEPRNTENHVSPARVDRTEKRNPYYLGGGSTGSSSLFALFLG